MTDPHDDADQAEPATSVIRISVLGPLVIEVGGAARVPGPPLRQAVLAFLSARAGTVVSKEQLMDAIWGEDLPGDAIGNIYTYIAGLRRQLEPGHRQRAVDGVLSTVSGGYCLRLPPAHLDSARFLALRARARTDAAGDPTGAARSLRDALGMWRGTPLQGVPGPFAEAERVRLTGLRLTAVEEHAGLLLELGQADAAAHELSPVVRDHPLRESAHALMMTALDHCGHRDEALELYDRVHDGLREHLGVSPGSALRELHRRLRDGSTTTGTTGTTAPGPPGPATEPAASDGAAPTGATPGRAEPDESTSDQIDPGWNGSSGGTDPGDTAPADGPPDEDRPPVDHLPPRPRRFVGRRRELADLDALLVTGDGPRLCVVDAGGGTGKTTLAVEWAHRAADGFPDGCLHAELRGFNPSDPPLAAAEALNGFLVALGVSPDQVPHTVSARAALFRARTRDLRLLVVLDDARSSDQVLPLLPDGAGCATVVTSRRRLDTLVVRHGAHMLHLEPMSTQDARDLLDACAGVGRTDAEPDAADDLLYYCAGLPLTVAVVGNRVPQGSPRPLGELRDRLRHYDSHLDVLAAGPVEVGADLRAVFRASTDELSPAARAAFALLGVFPGSDIDACMAAALLDASPRHVAALLGELTANNLLGEAAAGGYRFHDLVREFAREQAEELLTADDLVAARDRLFSWSLFAAREASTRIEPSSMNAYFPVPAVPWPAGVPDDRAGATRWFSSRQRTLVAIAELAFSCGRDDVAWQLPAIMINWFYLNKNWPLWLRSLRIGAEAARRDGAMLGLAQIRTGSGLAHLDLRRFRQARKQLTRAAVEFARVDDQWQMGTTMVLLGYLYLRTGRPDQALHAFESGRQAFARIDNLWGTAWALSEVGRALLTTGDPAKATPILERATTSWRKVGYARGEADSTVLLGAAHLDAGRTAEASRQLRKAERMYRGFGDDYRQAQAQVAIGRAHDRDGDTAAAREVWCSALAVFERLGAPDAAECLRLLGDRAVASGQNSPSRTA